MPRKRKAQMIIAGLILAAVIAVGFYPPAQDWIRDQVPVVLTRIGLTDASATGPDGVYWCPMHPQIKRSAPEMCPICNMALVPLTDEGQADDYEGLKLTARHVQQAGVVTEPVVKRSLYREIDTTGRIVYDERRLAKITSWVYGRSRLDKLLVNFTGEKVEKGELLAELFSPDLIVAQQELLSALAYRTTPETQGLVDAARRKLRYQGHMDAQIERLIESRRALESIPIRAPISGTVIARHVSEGQYVKEGEPLFDIADLSHLWLYADIYEDELPLVGLGQPVELTVRSQPGEVFRGRVAFIDPFVQPDSRTVRVRVDISNREGKLKPGMYARVGITKELPPMLAVPGGAVLWSGRRTVVIVKEGPGRFRPVEVKLGQKWLYPAVPESDRQAALEFSGAGRQYQEVLAGLSRGHEVVTAGTFLLNAESQFQSALVKLLPPESVSVTLTELLGDELAAHVENVLDAYHGVSRTLAEDHIDQVPAEAGRLAAAAKRLVAAATQGGEPTLAAAARRVTEAAETLAAGASQGPDAARTGFGAISRALVELLAEHGGRSLLGKDLFVFECPMADPFSYKLWLQPDDDMQNPYMGQRMLKCGTKLEVLEP